MNLHVCPVESFRGRSEPIQDYALNSNFSLKQLPQCVFSEATPASKEDNPVSSVHALELVINQKNELMINVIVELVEKQTIRNILHGIHNLGNISLTSLQQSLFIPC